MGEGSFRSFIGAPRTPEYVRASCLITAVLTSKRRLPIRDRFRLDLHYMATKWAALVLPVTYFSLKHEPSINDYHPWLVRLLVKYST